MQVFVIFLQLIVLYCTAGTAQNVTNATASVTNVTDSPVKGGKAIVEKKTAAKYDNPNFVKDRKGDNIFKPQRLPVKNPFKKPYHPYWQQYCEPRSCSSYNKVACGLNRINMRFKWFASNCHLILNNQCADYRGALKYDMVANKYCQVYVMYLRKGCIECDDVDDEVPVCAVNRSTAHVVLFKNRCAMDKENCKKDTTDYQEVQMFLCEFYLKSLVK